ncbi:MAG: NAD(P)/FAD-dependent oxidoreductase, partial [Oscillospiraceae bacterium]
MSKHFELLILGGGPGGYSAALAAARGKKKVALFECEHLGGTCLNVGCIPTKYLLDKAAALEKIRAMTQKNLLRDAGSFSFRNMQAGKGEVVDKLVGGVEFLLKKQGVTTVRGEAKLLPDRRVLCNGEEYDGDAIIIATGSEPILPPIPGVEHTLDSTGVLALSHLPRSLAVIGGGVIGLELASAYASFGTAVSVIEMQSSLLPNELPKAAAQLSSALKKRGIGIHTGFSVKRIETRENGYAVVAGQGETEREFLADVVLMAIGRKPALRGVDAKALNLAMTPRGAIAVDDHLCTNLPGVYAIGDVIGGYQLAHAAYAEGEAAVAHLLGRDEAL